MTHIMEAMRANPRIATGNACAPPSGEGTGRSSRRSGSTPEDARPSDGSDPARSSTPRASRPNHAAREQPAPIARYGRFAPVVRNANLIA